MSEPRRFSFLHGFIFKGYATAIWILLTFYFLWRIAQVIAGQVPTWVAFVAAAALVYIWYMRLAAVRTLVVERDGRVVFTRGLGRREVMASDVESIRPLFRVSRRNFVLRHAGGWELLFDDPSLVGEVARELVRWNPALKVRGGPAGDP